jgi:hypothetical protein
VQTRCKQLVEALSVDFSHRLLQIVTAVVVVWAGIGEAVVVDPLPAPRNITWGTTGSKAVSEGVVQRYGTIIILNHFFFNFLSNYYYNLYLFCYIL